MSCGASGEIEVEGTNSEGRARVSVPVSLSCPVQADSALVSYEVFQGPPVYKMDFETGEEFGRAPMARPEDGSPAKSPVPWGLASYGEELRRMANAWSADDNGFVTSVWRKRSAVAVAVRHHDDAQVPEVAAAIHLDGVRTPLPEVYRETHPADGGYITDIVFDIDRLLYTRGAELHVSADSGDAQSSASLTLFGEEVPNLDVTWIPVVLDDVPEEHPIDAEEAMEIGVLPWWPIGDFTTGVGPPMTYKRTEGDGRGGTPDIDHNEAMYQLVDHRLLHACGPQEIYYGISNSDAMDKAGLDVPQAAIAAVDQWVAFSPGVIDRYDELTGRFLYGSEGHEMGHMFGLGHSACNVDSDERDGYPYEGASLGPARSWDFVDSRFAGRLGMRGVEIPAIYRKDPGDEYVDLMSYCYPGIASDFNYQRALLMRQSEEYWAPIETTPPDDCTPAAADKPVEGIVSKSAVDSAPQKSLAVSGSVDAHGIAVVRMAQATLKPPWPGPATGNLVLTVLDAGGREMHRQAVRTSLLSHSDGRQLWSARIPYFEGAATVVLRTLQGDIRATREIMIPE